MCRELNEEPVRLDDVRHDNIVIDAFDQEQLRPLCHPWRLHHGYYFGRRDLDQRHLGESLLREFLSYYVEGGGNSVHVAFYRADLLIASVRVVVYVYLNFRFRTDLMQKATVTADQPAHQLLRHSEVVSGLFGVGFPVPVNASTWVKKSSQWPAFHKTKTYLYRDTRVASANKGRSVKIN